MTNLGSRVPSQLIIAMRYGLDADSLAFYLACTCRFTSPPILAQHPAQLRDDLSRDHAIMLLDENFAQSSTMAGIARRTIANGHVVVLLTERPGDELASALTFAGTQHLFDTREDMRGLAMLINAIMTGHSRYTGYAAQTWAHAVTSDPPALTRRELQVVELYTDPSEPSVDTVAQALQISPYTVKAHLANVRKKLGSRSTRNRTALHSALTERGWV